MVWLKMLRIPQSEAPDTHPPMVGDRDDVKRPAGTVGGGRRGTLKEEVRPADRCIRLTPVSCSGAAASVRWRTPGEPGSGRDGTLGEQGLILGASWWARSRRPFRADASGARP